MQEECSPESLFNTIKIAFHPRPSIKACEVPKSPDAHIKIVDIVASIRLL